MSKAASAITLDRIVEACPEAPVDLHVPSETVVNDTARGLPRGGLSSATDQGISTMSQFGKYIENGGKEGAPPLYLFDWSVQVHCPALLKDFVVPRYIAHDLLRDMQLSTHWPSLLIGPKGSGSGVHVDDYETHFWMILLSGRKKWRIFPREDMDTLGFNYFDRSFPFTGLPKSRTWKWINHTTPWEFEMHSGDMVLVPHGMAHMVENLEASVAIAGNTVDEVNWEDFVVLSKRASTITKERTEMLDAVTKLDSVSSPPALNLDQHDAPWHP